MSTINKPQELMISPGKLLVLSKSSAVAFHLQMKEMIKDTGYGLIEYLEVVNFFTKVKDAISGNSQSKIPPDSEFIDMVREEVAKYPKGVMVTARGVKIENAETGTSYDFSGCDDPELALLEFQLAELKEKIEERKNFLKTLPAEGLEIHIGEGNLQKVYPPIKTSKSNYKITFPK